MTRKRTYNSTPEKSGCRCALCTGMVIKTNPMIHVHVTPPIMTDDQQHERELLMEVTQ